MVSMWFVFFCENEFFATTITFFLRWHLACTIAIFQVHGFSEHFFFMISMFRLVLLISADLLFGYFLVIEYSLKALSLRITKMLVISR